MQTGTGRTLEALPVFNRRLATGAGAVLLGLAALTFAKLGDLAQARFLAIEAVWP